MSLCDPCLFYKTPGFQEPNLLTIFKTVHSHPESYASLFLLTICIVKRTPDLINNNNWEKKRLIWQNFTHASLFPFLSNFSLAEFWEPFVLVLIICHLNVGTCIDLYHLISLLFSRPETSRDQELNFITVCLPALRSVGSTYQTLCVCVFLSTVMIITFRHWGKKSLETILSLTELCFCRWFLFTIFIKCGFEFLLIFELQPTRWPGRFWYLPFSLTELHLISYWLGPWPVLISPFKDNLLQKTCNYKSFLCPFEV